MTNTIENLAAMIQAAAMRVTTHDVFVDYAGHVKSLTVSVNPIGTEYDGSEFEMLMYDVVYLDRDDALPLLMDVLKRLDVVCNEVVV